MTFYSCTKPEPVFTTSYVIAFFVLSYLIWEVVVLFGDFGGIVDYHCLKFLFIKPNLSCKTFQGNMEIVSHKTNGF
jgi:hypothetical protein